MVYIPTIGTPEEEEKKKQEQQVAAGMSGGTVAPTEQTPTATTTPYNPPTVVPQQTSAGQALLNPVQQQLSEKQTNLTDLVSGFKQQAGGAIQYGQPQQQALQQAVQQGGTSIDQARQVLATQYGGPTQLDTTPDVSGLQTSLKGLGTAGGINTMLSQVKPGLTPGQLKMETSLLARSPQFKQQVSQVGTGLQGLQTQIENEQKAALDLAAQRQAEAEKVRQQGTQYLTQYGGNIMSDLQQKAAAEQANTEKIKQQYQQIQQGGVGALQQIAPQMVTPELRAAEDAKLLTEAINNKFGSLGGVAPASLGISKKGKEQLVGGNQTPEFLQRQAILSELFRPQAALTTQLASGAATPQDLTTAQLRQFTNPLYFGGGQQQYQPLSAADYVNMFEPQQYNPELFATSEQQAQYGNVMDLLGKQERLTAPVTPFAPAALTQNQQVAQAQQSALADYAKQVAGKERQFATDLEAQRKAYRAAQKAKAGLLGGTLGSIPGLSAALMGFGPLGLIAGSLGGKAIGEQFA